MTAAPPLPTLRDVFAARAALRGVVRATPLLEAPRLSEAAGVPVSLKLETVQDTGSFKVRGAANKLRSLDAEARRRGVVAVSTGNHGRAVAAVARRLGVPATVCVSRAVPPHKVEALRRLEVELVVDGAGQDEAEERAAALVRERGLALVHPFDDAAVIAGQGTIGLELLDEAPETDTVLVPLSGGGLIAGIALALKAASPEVRVVGVSMERGAAMVESLAAGRPVQVPEEETLADSLQGGIGLDNRYTLRCVRDLVDEVAQVSEEEIGAAMAFALRERQLVLEGAAAVGIAALRTGRVRPRGRTAVVLSGANADAAQLTELLERHPGRRA